MGSNGTLVLVCVLVFIPLVQGHATPVLSGDIVVAGFPPLTPNLRPGLNENDDHAFLILETIGTLAPPGLGLPPGALIDNWLVHADAVSPPTVFLGQVRFDRRIVSVAAAPTTLRNRDFFVAANGGPLPVSGYMGPGRPAFPFRGLEGRDAFVIGPGGFGPRTIRFRLVTRGVIDELRITTLSAVPEPGTFWIAGLGLTGLWLIRRRLRSRLSCAVCRR